MALQNKNEKKANDVWVIVPMFRFYKSEQYRKGNFIKFQENLTKQGVRLAVIESRRPENEWLVEPGDADLVIRKETSSILWHKERLINLATKELPKECQYVAWFDGDCILENNNWPEEGKALLENHCAVQLCSSIDFLDADGSVERKKGMYVANVRKGVTAKSMGGRTEGSPGFCWMMKRKLLDKVSIYDKAIVGGGDVLFVNMALRQNMAKQMLANGDPGSKQYKDYVRWNTLARGLTKDLQSASYVEGASQHLWHEERRYRLYGARHFLLLLHNFDPKTHLEVEQSSGLYVMRDKRIRKLLEGYFWLREAEKTPEHDRVFDAYEVLMNAVKDVGQIKRRLSMKASMREQTQLQTAMKAVSSPFGQ